MLQNQVIFDECKKLNIELTNQQVEQFIHFYDMLVEWNKVMNLTGITEFHEVVIKHFVDSLAITNIVDLDKNPKSILDLGTGAGFPGIPIKIAFPKCKILLVDSLNKRVKFLNEVIRKLGLQDIEAIHARAENLGKKKEYREQYDYCVSRAVANMSVLGEYCLPFVKLQGAFLPYKSGEIQEELNKSKHAISLLGGKIIDCKTFYLPDTDIQRSIVYIKKVKETSKMYPRNEGKPSKEPLV